MNQYSTTKQTAVLLKSPPKLMENNKVRLSGGMAELIIDGNRVVVPTAEAFNKLLVKIENLESKLSNLNNKTSAIASKL
jgi:hypothetical protein